jgi:hypothetical protein
MAVVERGKPARTHSRSSSAWRAPRCEVQARDRSHASDPASTSRRPDIRSSAIRHIAAVATVRRGAVPRCAHLQGRRCTHSDSASCIRYGEDDAVAVGRSRATSKR